MPHQGPIVDISGDLRIDLAGCAGEFTCIKKLFRLQLSGLHEEGKNPDVCKGRVNIGALVECDNPVGEAGEALIAERGLRPEQYLLPALQLFQANSVWSRGAAILVSKGVAYCRGALGTFCSPSPGQPLSLPPVYRKRSA